MRVSLTALTQPLIGTLETAEELVSYTARISNPSNQLRTETASKLIRYCIDKGHWSIFEVASATVEIETSRAIAAQLLRHRSFTFQEFSQRYADASTLGFEQIRARRQDLTNRQSSVDDLPADIQDWFEQSMRQTQEDALDLYETALRLGIAKESARFLLPLSTSTKLYMTGNLRSWIHYLAARTAPETQLEHREIAFAIRDLLSKEFPTIAEAAGWIPGEVFP